MMYNRGVSYQRVPVRGKKVNVPPSDVGGSVFRKGIGWLISIREHYSLSGACQEHSNVAADEATAAKDQVVFGQAKPLM
jgi:hypothetical protein